MRPLISVHDLSVSFPVRGGVMRRVTGRIRAVEGISFDLLEGSTLGIVGESGSGKTTLANAILGLVPVDSGSVVFDGRELIGLSTSAWKGIRRRIQVVFQDPFTSLNPRMRIGEIVSEGRVIHGMPVGREEIIEILGKTGIGEDALERYPHEFSGGERQRIAIARALAVEPRLLILDEATSSLDLLNQAGILNLLLDLKEELSLTYIFITHDLSIVEFMADRIIVMEKGEAREEGRTGEIFASPRHPYTRRLLESRPKHFA